MLLFMWCFDSTNCTFIPVLMKIADRLSIWCCIGNATADALTAVTAADDMTTQEKSLNACKEHQCIVCMNWTLCHAVSAEAVQQLLAVADDLDAKGTPIGKGTTAKAWAVQHILLSCKKRKEKLVIFSQYLTDLDELELVLQEVCMPTQINS